LNSLQRKVFFNTLLGSFAKPGVSLWLALYPQSEMFVNPFSRGLQPAKSFAI
jgi:hypothetical protein